MLSQTSIGPAAQARLTEIAEQVGDGWIRCRGPLTGMKSLVAARNEAAELGADASYMALLDQIVAAAKALNSGQFNGAFKDATRILDEKIPQLRLCAAERALA